MKKRLTAIICLLSVLLSACSTATVDDNENEIKPDSVQADTTVEIETEEETEILDDVPEMSFDGSDFDIITREVGHLNYHMNIDEILGDAIDDAIFNRNRGLEQRFDIVISELTDTDANKALNTILAQDDTFELIKTRAPMAITFVRQNLSYKVTDIPYIDLAKPYWDQNINKDLTIGHNQYFVTGALSVTEYDETNAILFNKQLIDSYQLESPYDYVREGNWTMDKMAEMMEVVVNDVDGDGQMTDNDMYGYLATGKHVLSAFLLSAGEKAISKDENDIPYLSMDHERYYDVVEKTFAITYDNNAWYIDTTEANVSDKQIQMFSENKALFMHTVMYFLESLREMENDFGVIPYPKYDINQERFYSRTSWVEPFLVPITNNELDMAGAVIEAMCCESSKTVIPAYYETSLKGKISRDEESGEMLDLIFANRILCLGDTIWCDFIRVGFLDDMIEYNDRNLTSKLKKASKMLDRELSNLSDIISD